METFSDHQHLEAIQGLQIMVEYHLAYLEASLQEVGSDGIWVEVEKANK